MLIGGLLIVVGAVGYGVSESKSATALIPAFIGLALAVLGWLSRQDHLRKHVMHAAALIGLVGFVVPAVRSFPQLPALFAGEAALPAAVASQAITAVICAVFVGLCVKSFIDARRARKASGE